MLSLLSCFDEIYYYVSHFLSFASVSNSQSSLLNVWNKLTTSARYLIFDFLFFVCVHIFSSSFDGPDADSSSGGCGPKDSKSFSREIPIFLSCATPDEFLVWLILSKSRVNIILGVKLPELFIYF